MSQYIILHEITHNSAFLKFKTIKETRLEESGLTEYYSLLKNIRNGASTQERALIGVRESALAFCSDVISHMCL